MWKFSLINYTYNATFIPNCFILIIDNSKFTYLENLNLEKGFYNVNVNENSYIENYITKTKYQTVNNFDLELINNYILKLNQLLTYVF